MKEIVTVIRNNYGRYDNVPINIKAELFQFSINDLAADIKLHSLLLKELDEKMYSADLFDDYMNILDVTRKSRRMNYRKLIVIVMINDGIGADK